MSRLGWTQSWRLHAGSGSPTSCPKPLVGKIRLIELREAEREQAGSAD